jgi:hypothetical protein
LSSLIGYQFKGKVCVAVFMPPDAGSQYDAWRLEHADDYGAPDDWTVNLGRARGGDFVSVWVAKRHLPPGFAIGKRLR